MLRLKIPKNFVEVGVSNIARCQKMLFMLEKRKKLTMHIQARIRIDPKI